MARWLPVLTLHLHLRHRSTHHPPQKCDACRQVVFQQLFSHLEAFTMHEFFLAKQSNKQDFKHDHTCSRTAQILRELVHRSAC